MSSATANTAQPIDTAPAAPALPSTLTWSDDLLNDHVQMDATHREFVEQLVQLEGLLGQSDEAVLACYDALIEHTADHFGQEDRWMADLGFTPDNCHSLQHTQVLAVLKEVRRLYAEAGERVHLGRLLPELMQWFESHVQAADAGLAAYMKEVDYDPITREIRRPPPITEATDGQATAHAPSSCGSSSC